MPDTMGITERFTRLHEQFDRRLFAYLFLETKDREEADDLLQTVWLRVWQALPVARETGFMWLRKIAYHLLIDYRRARSARITALSLDSASEPVELDAVDERADSAAIVQIREVIRHALLMLPEKQRRVLWLMAQEYSYEEIMQQCHISYQTATKQVQLARRKIRASLGCA